LFFFCAEIERPFKGVDKAHVIQEARMFNQPGLSLTPNVPLPVIFYTCSNTYIFIYIYIRRHSRGCTCAYRCGSEQVYPAYDQAALSAGQGREFFVEREHRVHLLPDDKAVSEQGVCVCVCVCVCTCVYMYIYTHPHPHVCVCVCVCVCMYIYIRYVLHRISRLYIYYVCMYVCMYIYI